MYKVVKFGKTINVQIMVDFVHNYGVNVIIIVSINVQIIANILNTIFVQTIVDFVHNNGFWCEPVINNACYFIITLTWNVAMGMTNIFFITDTFLYWIYMYIRKIPSKKDNDKKKSNLIDYHIFSRSTTLASIKYNFWPSRIFVSDIYNIQIKLVSSSYLFGFYPQLHLWL